MSGVPVCIRETLPLFFILCFQSGRSKWKRSLSALLDTLDSEVLKADVAAFLEHPQDAELLTAEHFCQLLK